MVPFTFKSSRNNSARSATRKIAPSILPPSSGTPASWNKMRPLFVGTITSAVSFNLLVTLRFNVLYKVSDRAIDASSSTTSARLPTEMGGLVHICRPFPDIVNTSTSFWHSMAAMKLRVAPITFCGPKRSPDGSAIGSHTLIQSQSKEKSNPDTVRPYRVIWTACSNPLPSTMKSTGNTVDSSSSNTSFDTLSNLY